MITRRNIAKTGYKIKADESCDIGEIPRDECPYNVRTRNSPSPCLSGRGYFLLPSPAGRRIEDEGKAYAEILRVPEQICTFDFPLIKSRNCGRCE
jgi:hypothetical protein